MPRGLLRKEKEKMRETARPRLKKISVRQQHANWLFWLPQTNLQTAFELQQNRSLYYDVAKKIDLVEITSKVFPQKAMRVMKDILIFALDFAGGEF